MDDVSIVLELTRMTLPLWLCHVQADGDVLTQQECLLKYPTLVPL